MKSEWKRKKEKLCIETISLFEVNFCFSSLSLFSFEMHDKWWLVQFRHISVYLFFSFFSSTYGKIERLIELSKLKHKTNARIKYPVTISWLEFPSQTIKHHLPLSEQHILTKANRLKPNDCSYGHCYNPSSIMNKNHFFHLSIFVCCFSLFSRFGFVLITFDISFCHKLKFISFVGLSDCRVHMRLWWVASGECIFAFFGILCFRAMMMFHCNEMYTL